MYIVGVYIYAMSSTPRTVVMFFFPVVTKGAKALLYVLGTKKASVNPFHEAVVVHNQSSYETSADLITRNRESFFSGQLVGRYTKYINARRKRVPKLSTLLYIVGTLLLHL